MAGDYTRLTFDSRRDHAGVLMQQGRVLLDADWNEHVEEQLRRIEAGTLDTIGRATVPRETPDGFKIEAAGGTLTIGPGRIYVDGLLAENHGDEPLAADVVLGGVQGTTPIPYDRQPYLPDPPPLPSGGPHVAYLDVWQREVTSLEESGLVDQAVGVDTTTRLQTVWQVRLLELDGGADVDCSTPDENVPGWLAATAPSAGRLSVAAVGVPASDDPCIIPPNGGFRGTENRLYRVEIHDPGPEGTATFKWSRDNASIATAVTAIDGSRTQLTVTRIGRDAVLRFRPGDWIEVVDDEIELAGEPGVMRKVLSVDEVRLTITLADPLPAGTFDATVPARHTRVERWDHSGAVRDPNGNIVADVDAANGVVPVPAAATAIVLEDGVRITFTSDPAGGGFHTGDYWVFAARTADASVEELVEAPPRGILHHYCRLAVVTFPDDEQDCRTLWPPAFGADCECAACVSADSHNSGRFTIQQAVADVRAGGGTICLGPGRYELGGTRITIEGARSLRLRGRGAATVLAYTGTGPAIDVVGSVDVALERLAVEIGRGHDEAASQGFCIGLRNSLEVRVEHCALAQPRVEPLPAIAVAGALSHVVVRENAVVAAVGIGNVMTRSPHVELAAVSAAAPALIAGLSIDDNVFFCRERGISLDGVTILAAATRLSGNYVSGCADGGIVVLGLVTQAIPGSIFAATAHTRLAAAGRGQALSSQLDITGNTLLAAGPGIVVGVDDARIASNHVHGAAAGAREDGIVLARGLDAKGIDRCQVLANRITDVGARGIVLTGIVLSALVKDNVIANAIGGGIVMAGKGGADELSVENNQIFNAAAEGAAPTAAGIFVRDTREAEVASNVVVGVGAEGKHAAVVGIVLVNCDSARIVSNEVADIGPEPPSRREGVGIAVIAPSFERIDVDNNLVRRRRVRPKQPDTARWIGVSVLAPQKVEGGTFLGLGEPVRNVLGALRKIPRGREIVGVRGNLVEAIGRAPAVEVRGGGACVFSDNRCFLTAPRPRPTVEIAAGALVASGNYIEGPVHTHAIEAGVGGGPFTVLGNIATGDIFVNGQPLEAPWKQLNVVAL